MKGTLVGTAIGVILSILVGSVLLALSGELTYWTDVSKLLTPCALAGTVGFFAGLYWDYRHV